eukprot:8520383-Alexandrium_andersonii.AAC.1
MSASATSSTFTTVPSISTRPNDPRRAAGSCFCTSCPRLNGPMSSATSQRPSGPAAAPRATPTLPRGRGGA